ncbi:MAG TPA: BACON domain-containing carbohydrate-binding protein [Isosphaeraceae bacterium]|nr:BACON domain-containing carbohydrate-binding protein [Isosphaeraceae bacterium]
MASLDPSSLDASASGALSNLFNVIAGEFSTEWMAIPDDSWLTVIDPVGPVTGNASVLYAVAANEGAARNGSITITGFDLVFSVNQAAAVEEPPVEPPVEHPPLAPIGPGGQSDNASWADLMCRFNTEVAAAQTNPFAPPPTTRTIEKWLRTLTPSSPTL